MVKTGKVYEENNSSDRYDIFLSGATTCEYDKQGRINIPKPLIDYASLEKDCIIIEILIKKKLIYSISEIHTYLKHLY